MNFETKLRQLKILPHSDEYESKGLNLIADARPIHLRQFLGWAMAASLLISIAMNVYLIGQVNDKDQNTNQTHVPNLHTQEQVQFMSIPGVKDTPQVVVMESRL